MRMHYTNLQFTYVLSNQAMMLCATKETFKLSTLHYCHIITVQGPHPTMQLIMLHVTDWHQSWYVVITVWCRTFSTVCRRHMVQL